MHSCIPGIGQCMRHGTGAPVLGTAPCGRPMISSKFEEILGMESANPEIYKAEIAPRCYPQQCPTNSYTIHPTKLNQPTNSSIHPSIQPSNHPTIQPANQPSVVSQHQSVFSHRYVLTRFPCCTRPTSTKSVAHRRPYTDCAEFRVQGSGFRV